MITIQKLKIYAAYSGDEDHLARVGKKLEKELFENNSDWFDIMNLYQDILLISKSLTSEHYKNAALEKMKNICDDESYKFLITKISN